MRAEQLRSPAMRSRLADGLLKTLDDARSPERFSLRLHPHRAEIRDCAEDLLALVPRLQDDQPIDVRGAAMTALLLTSGASPLDPTVDGAYERRCARRTLNSAAPTVHALATAAQKGKTLVDFALTAEEEHSRHRP